MIVSEENRAVMLAYRKGCTLDEYLNSMWKRREVENPQRVQAEAKSTGLWPIGKEQPSATVTKIRAKGPRNG